MYKRDLIRNFIYRIRLKYFFLFVVLSAINFKNWSQNIDYFSESSDTIVVITLNSLKEYRGLLIDENEKIITLDIANNEKVFYKSEIKHIKYISRDEIKKTKEFENTNPIFTKYCYLPSAYITSEKNVSTNSHYFVTSNSKVGVNENFEFSLGNIFLVNVISSLTYSQNFRNYFKGAISVIGSFNLISPVDFKNRCGYGLIPRITFGNEYKNTTIGVITYQFPEIGSIPRTFVYGGYLGSQKKIAEKFTIAGETMGITTDGFQYLLITNLILNFRRNIRENWSAGITLLSTNSIDFTTAINSNTASIIPIPYIGIQRDF